LKAEGPADTEMMTTSAQDESGFFSEKPEQHMSGGCSLQGYLGDMTMPSKLHLQALVASGHGSVISQNSTELIS